MSTKRARVLVAIEIDGKSYKPNDIVTVEADLLETLYHSKLDGHADSVAYADKIHRKRAANLLAKAELDDVDD